MIAQDNTNMLPSRTVAFGLAAFMALATASASGSADLDLVGTSKRALSQFGDTFLDEDACMYSEEVAVSALASSITAVSTCS